MLHFNLGDFLGCAGASYNGGSAKNYADSWATSYNVNYTEFSDDCTNFVTQAMVTGGFPLVRGFYENANVFYNDTSAFYNDNLPIQGEDSRAESLSGTVVQSLYNYLLNYNHGALIGTYRYQADGNAPSYMPSSIVSGDVLFYNWGQGMGISHATMMVGSGTDSGGYVGDWIDAHTSFRYHVFWTLKEFKAYWQTTSVSYVHITG